MTHYDVIVRPLVTEKGVGMKETGNVICFEVHPEATKTQIRSAVEKLFKIKVDQVRTVVTVGKLRRRGRFSGYRGDWKKAYVRVKAGEKLPEFAEV